MYVDAQTIYKENKMVIPYEIGMIEHCAHNVPTVIAKEDIINGFIGIIRDDGTYDAEQLAGADGYNPVTVNVPTGEIPDWVQPTGAHDAYQIGDKVRYKGAIWECEVANNAYPPDVYGWRMVEEVTT